MEDLQKYRGGFKAAECALSVFVSSQWILALINTHVKCATIILWNISRYRKYIQHSVLYMLCLKKTDVQNPYFFNLIGAIEKEHLEEKTY